MHWNFLHPVRPEVGLVHDLLAVMKRYLAELSLPTEGSLELC